MADRFDPSVSSAPDDEATLQSERLTEDVSLAAKDTSRLPLDELASAGLTMPRFARLTRQLGSADQTGRRSSRAGSAGALIMATLVVALIGFVLVHLAPAHSTLADSPTGTPSGTALAAATTAATSTTDRATPASTTTTRAASGGSGTSNSGGGVNQPAGPVFAGLFSLNVDSHGSMKQSGDAFSSNECSPSVTVDSAYTLTVQPPATEVHYYVRHSDGTSDGSAAQPHVITFVQNPVEASAVSLDTSWTFPYTLATGSPQWLELDILTPAPFTLRVDFTALCTFSPEFPTLAVTPQGYDCAAGGNQTFTFTGDLHASYAVGSHTITYHWKRYDGSVTPDQTVTFAQGVTSIPAQPDTMVINSSVFPTAPVDILVEANQTGPTQSTVLSPGICFPTPTPVIPTPTPVS